MSESIVTLINAPGWRPESLRIFQKYLNQQTYSGVIQWVVIDDQSTPLQLGPLMANIQAEIRKGPTVWQEGLNTQKVNLTEALKYVKGKYLFFAEEDDFINPKFIETMVWMLDRFVLVGESNSKYFNVAVPGWKQMSNFRHASLSSTGMRIEALPHLQAAIAAQGLYIDIELWGNVRRAGLPTLLFSDKQLSVGIKGMPGRAGIGVGHTKTKDYLIDPKGDKLAEWIGADIVNYRPFLSNKFVKKETISGVPNGQETKKTSWVEGSQKENRARSYDRNAGPGNSRAKETQGVQRQTEKPIT